MKIICKNCYHKWEGKFGETDLFFCHKCGYDINTKKIDLDKLKNWIKNNQKIVGENIQKIIKQNENVFPISSLVKQAKKFDNFKDFSRWYSIGLNHGYYWHLTDNKNFQISDTISPRDMSSMSFGINKENYGDLMITGDLEHWDDYYNTNPHTWKKDVKRNYVALFDASDLEPQILKQVSRGFGNEIYLDKSDAKKLKLLGVYNREYARRLNNKFQKIIPQSEEELEKLYNYAKGIKSENNLIQKIIKETVSDLFDERKSEVENFRNNLAKNLGITLELYFVNPETGPALKLPLIKVPKELQRQGLGTKAMEEIIKYADEKGYRIFLTPSTDWGSSKSGLLRFYKSFGFVPHSGRNRDYHFKDDMVRIPK